MTWKERRQPVSISTKAELMTQLLRALTVLTAFVVLALPGLAGAQTTTGIPPEITTPDKVQSRLD